MGANPSTVEVDFDLFTFTSGGPAAFEEVVFDDMEHGNPFGNGWFAFGAVYGFLSCLAMVLVAKGLGYLLKRPHDYYREADDD